MSLRHLCAGLVLAYALFAVGCACCGHHCRPATVSSAPPCCPAPVPAPCNPCCPGGAPGAVPLPATSGFGVYH
jgi:hypothetical protein